MRIKICGMSEQQLVDHAAGLGVDLCGLIFYPPSPRNVTPSQAAALDTHGMVRVGVFVKQGPDETARIVEQARLDFVQLHGGQGAEFAAVIPPERTIRVLWPKRYGDLASLQADIDRLADLCGILLLDAGMGSGMTLDWAALAELRFPKPWFLSGGLGPENIGRALSLLSPDGLDLNSKLESTPGRKNAGLMSAAVRAAGRMPASA